MQLKNLIQFYFFDSLAFGCSKGFENKTICIHHSSELGNSDFLVLFLAFLTLSFQASHAVGLSQVMASTGSVLKCIFLYPVHVPKPTGAALQWVQAVAATSHGWTIGMPPRLAPCGPSQVDLTRWTPG